MKYRVKMIGENGEIFVWHDEAEDRDHAEGLAMDAFKEEYGDTIDCPQIYDMFLLNDGKESDEMSTEYKTLEAFFIGNLWDHIRDLAEHGADGGFPGITMTSECVEAFDKYQDEIWEMLAEMAEDVGETIPQLIAGFNRVDMTWTADGFKNLMLWFACEKMAQDAAFRADDPHAEDGEIVGLDENGKNLMLMNYATAKAYDSGMTIEEYGPENIRPHEWVRISDWSR